MSATWWCVKVAPGKEGRVRAQLLPRVAALGARVVVPTQPWVRRAHRTVWRKLRPGYLFIQAPMSERLVNELDACRGVGALDSVNGVPRPVPDAVARQLEAGHVGPPPKQRAPPRSGRIICAGHPARGEDLNR